ncbi:NTP transferase domain-containing protein [Aliihoeflea aestuarii]|uniref:NTP transferase domain-containing protein n=1 Tax=Aliihoeflea aestuarii TaxID=453840 RepID=UPI002092CEFB|nr:molybdopterin-binding/glycosyltransferase family 2 protein [Aliihoeflea aestuarii]MCO6390506.1 NTP transferase domain-containing protein [Aliihoeflea aestuarii]
MKFGAVDIEAAEGSILAHSLIAGGVRFRKAHRLSAQDIKVLAAAGIRSVVAARLDADDFDENRAAAEMAANLSVRGVDIRDAATGRVNIHAAEAGLFTVDKGVVDALNSVDPAITIATLPPFERVQAGQMVATIKVIPFGVARDVLSAAFAVARSGEIFAVESFRSARVGLIQTTLSGVKPSVLDKTTKVTTERLARSGSVIVRETRVPHQEAELAEAVSAIRVDCDLLLIFGASAVCDWDDVIPAAIRRAGGRVERTGMPVDPGNLLVLGELDGTTVIGAPGCARSSKTNGFDWILDRILAGLKVTADDIARMGVGGLLMEIPQRPQPRELSTATRKVVVHAAILAAGRSSRMKGPNKLLAEFDGVPLIRRVAAATQGSRAERAHLIVGHQRDRIVQAVDELDIDIVDNPDFADGLSTSLKAAARAVPRHVDGLLVVLGDMPGVTAQTLDRMIAAFEHSGGSSIVRATHAGKRGNPVILPRALFAEIEKIEGDTGARHLVESAVLPVVDIELGEAASLDLDTQDAVRQAGGRIVEQA